MVVFRFYAKGSEDKDHDKDVVYRQGIFDDVSRDVFQCEVCLVSFEACRKIARNQLNVMQMSFGDFRELCEVVNIVQFVAPYAQQYVEAECEGHPYGAHDCRLL